ncbi:MAG: type II toxin-antitoxin system HicA family toxin [Raoultibacter sp.]
MPSETEREARRVIARLKKEGWQKDEGKGSHVIFRKDGKTISVPTSKKVLGLGLYLEIAKQVGWR